MRNCRPRESQHARTGSANAATSVVLLTAVVALILAFTALSGRTQVSIGNPGFVAGYSHPIQGIDHPLAMVAVGMWGVALGRPLIWALPMAFPLVMAIGAVMGMSRMPFPRSWCSNW